MHRVVTFTPNPALDVSTATNQMVAEIKMRCAEPIREPGGGGVNVSRVMKRLGYETLALYTSGGVTGDLFQQLVKEEQINDYPYLVSANTRENIMITDNSTNDLYRFIMAGGALLEKEWKELIRLVDDFDSIEYLVASGSLPPGVPDDFYARLSHRASERGIRFVLDTSGQPLKRIKEAGAFLLKPNNNELSELVECNLECKEDYIEAGRQVIEQYDVVNLVVSMGAEGAILITKDQVEVLPALQVEKRSTVGAGDSMVAGIVTRLLEGWDIREAVMYGQACGSAAIMTPGSGLARKQDADHLFKILQDRFGKFA